MEPRPDGEALPTPERTVPGLFLTQAERFGEKTSLRRFEPLSEGWVPVTWAEFRGRVVATAAALVEAGVAAGDRVALIGENSVDWLVSDLAIQAAAAVTVPIYPNLPSSTASLIAEDSEVTLAVAGGAELAAKLAPSAVRVLRMDAELADALAGTAASPPTELRQRLRDLRPHDIATIAYTSGTSGRPKGVVITHAAIVDTVRASSEIYDIRPTDVVLSFLPYSHILERVAGFYFGAVFAGAEYVLSRGLDHLAEDLQLVRPTCMAGVPRLFEKLVQSVQAGVARRPLPERLVLGWALAERRKSVLEGLAYRLVDRTLLRAVRRRVGGGRLRFFASGAAPLLPGVERYLWALGLPVYQGWGMTELTGVATCNTVSEHRFGTVGKALPGVQLRVAADGEILVRSPGVMREYHRNPEATAEAFSDGWLRTGDIGVVDEDGYLTITDRKKDLIKTSGGKYVAPQPIEARLQHDPCIQAAVLIGDGRPYVTALLLPDWDRLRAELELGGPPEQLAAERRVLDRLQEAVDVVNRDLASFETVKYFSVLPRALEIDRDEVTPTLKIKRRVVREHFQPQVDAMYEGGIKRPVAVGSA